MQIRPFNLVKPIFFLFFFLLILIFSTERFVNSKNLDDIDTEIANAQRVLEQSFAVIHETTAATNKIAELSSNQKMNEASLRNLGLVNLSLEEFLETNLSGDIEDNLQKLDNAKKNLEAARNKLPRDSTDEQVIKNRERLAEKIKEVETQTDAVKKNKEVLRKKLLVIYDFIIALFNDNSTPLALLEKTASDVDGTTLLRVLTTDFGNLAFCLDMQSRIEKDWEITAARTASVLGLADGEATAKKNKIVEVRDAVNAKAGTILGKVKPWLTTLKTSANVKNAEINDFLIKLFDKPEELSADALRKAQETIDLTDRLRQINNGWAEISVSLRKISVTDLPLEEIIKLAQDLDENTIRLRSRVVLLNDSQAGDMSKFTTEFISLYYFTDTQNLMRALNPAMYDLRDVSGLREEAERLRRDLSEADILLVDAQAEVNVLQRRLENLREELRQTEAKFLSSDILLTKATRKLDDLKSRPEKDEGKIKRAELEKTDLENENNANQANLDRLKNEQTGLPAKIRDAEDRLILAQERVRRARTNTLLLAQTESEAFAKAHESEKIYVAPIIGSSRDPLKRVFMYAFGDRKMIYLRGLKENVEKAKAAIALFDRPAPQARLTLWTLELNSTADYRGTKKFAEVLPIIENELANTRSRIAASLSYLRDTINIKVNEVAKDKLGAGEKTNREIRWARMHFYEDSVLKRLGFNFVSHTNQSPVADMMLPDPAGTTTLGEALVVLSLAKLEHRKKIMEDFQKNVDTELKKLGLPQSIIDEEILARNGINDKGCPPNVSDKYCWFAALNRAIGADNTQHKVNPGNLDFRYNYTSQQKEIIDAIIKSNRIRVVTRLEELIASYGVAQAKRVAQGRGSTSAEEDNLMEKILPLLGWLYQETGITPQQAINKSTLSSLPYKKEVGGVDLLRTANAQVARADLMLKQLIDAVDQDIDRHFVQPTINNLREKLVREKVVSVGVFNRTSVLSTNRLLARVDARASAQLPLGEETDILQSVQQLAQIYQAGITAGGLGVLGSLNAQPRKDVTEIYGLTTQSQFKVTPIFDPTGQTLRFKFDYVAANLVTEPTGTTNPQLPRIERHTVNTEVELNNLELREISRFNTNSKLGIAPRKWGGIPLIKDLPGMHHVPLLGWFVRKSGQSAVIQQSMIFGQTTMYPTIGDMLELLKSGDYLDFAFANKLIDCPEIKKDSEKKEHCPSVEEGKSVKLDEKSEKSLNESKDFQKLLLETKPNN